MLSRKECMAILTIVRDNLKKDSKMDAAREALNMALDDMQFCEELCMEDDRYEDK